MVILPLRTAATTAALRRTTHLLVSEPGRFSIGGVTFGASLESISSDGADTPPSSVSPARSAGDRSSPKVGCISSVSLFSDPIPPGQFPYLSRFFHDFGWVCHQFFLSFRRYPQKSGKARGVEYLNEPVIKLGIGPV